MSNQIGLPVPVNLRFSRDLGGGSTVQEVNHLQSTHLFQHLHHGAQSTEAAPILVPVLLGTRAPTSGVSGSQSISTSARGFIRGLTSLIAVKEAGIDKLPQTCSLQFT